MSKELDDLKLFGRQNRSKYLKDTDKYSIRKSETSQEFPVGMLEKRQLARDEISLIRDATTFAEIENLTIEF